MLDLGYLPGGGERADALGVSDGGTVVVGMSEISPSSGDYAAFIWDAANGMRNLRSVLEADYASCVEGWTLEMASAVSADGRTIAGVGDHPDGTRESWLVRIGPPPPYCPGDTNGDGIVDNADLQAVLDAWGATVGSPAFRCNADLANDGVIGNADLPVLLDNWATDCN
jgi:probable HAF family extracellular repeat protein